jgi:predicted RNA-binding protein YlxR (DUF448 family)
MSKTTQLPMKTMVQQKTRKSHRKHVPQRTCVACRQVRAARELTRIVRLAGGAVELDEKHKKSGRGAYLCSSKACWETALSKKLLEHALKTEIEDEEKEALWQHCGSLPAAPAEQAGAGSTP